MNLERVETVKLILEDVIGDLQKVANSIDEKLSRYDYLVLTRANLLLDSEEKIRIYEDALHELERRYPSYRSTNAAVRNYGQSLAITQRVRQPPREDS